MQLKDMDLGAVYQLKDGHVGTLRHINKFNEQCTFELAKEIQKEDKIIRQTWTKSYPREEVLDLFDPNQVSLF